MARRKKKAPPAPSFPSFPRLPIELQDEIWKIALDIDAPTAHFATVNHCFLRSSSSTDNTNDGDNNNSRSGPLRWELKAARIDTRDDESRSETIFPTRLALLLTCQHSRQTVERLSRNRAPTNTLCLEFSGQPSITCLSPFSTPETIRDCPPGRQTTIDTSIDLAILYNPWCTHIASQPAFGAEVVFPEIKFAGIFYAPEKMLGRVSRHEIEMEAVLRMFPELRVLYIIIHPDHARNRRFDPITQYMKDYYKACLKTEKEVPSKTFKSYDRIYYEMPRKLPLRMCDRLDTVIDKLWEISDRRQENETPETKVLRLVVRVMTWKHAPGVRGRCDT